MAASSFLNRAKMSVAGTPGTGTITLGSAVTQFASFAEAGAVNATKYPYLTEDGNDFEIGQGTYTASGPTFSRDTVYLSKISGVAGTTKLTLTSNALISIVATSQDLGFSWDNPNQRLGVGTNSPATKIVAAANNTTPQAPQFNETIQAAGADGASMGILLDAYGGAGSNGQFVGRRAFGTAASPSAVNAANTPLLQFGGSGYGATGYASSYRAMVQFRTGEAWTDSAQGAYVSLYSNPNGSASLAAEGYRLGPSGQPYFPLAATTASGANAFLDNATSPANELKRSTSSVAYKKDIEPLDPKYADAILSVQPIWYRSNIKSDRQDWSWYGISAEDLAAIEPRLVHWGYREDDFETVMDEESASSYRVLKDDAELKPDGVMYDRLTVMLLDLVRRLTNRVETLEGAKKTRALP